MIKVLNSSNGVGTEIRMRDYSEPLQNQKENTSYSSRYVYPIDFNYDIDNTDISLYGNQLIRIWRSMAKNPYIDFAIDDIINEMISFKDNEKFPIQLDLSDTSFSKKIRSKIHDEWLYIMKLLKFHKKSYTFLRDWFIDGKQYFYVDCGKTTIKSVLSLDPVRVKRINNEKNDKEWKYIYQNVELNSTLLELPKENVIELNSGLMDEKHQIWISYLNKAYIPLNQLQNIEDALLIYRISRAPERRVFYIDTGQLPKSKAETYMKEVIRNCRNKVEYDSSTGKIKESTLHMSLLDDIYLPRSSDGRATEVSQLNGGNGLLGDLSDLDYFKQKLFRSLNVPFTRWTDMSGSSSMLGRASEISRDEVKYRKFINRLRNFYNPLFSRLLKKQLALKNIITEKEYTDEYENIFFNWTSDSFFTELRDMEILQERLSVVDRMGNYIGSYFSTQHIKKNILRQTDEEIEKMKEEIAEEQKENQGNQGGFGGLGMPFGVPNVQVPQETPVQPEEQEQSSEETPNNDEPEKSTSDIIDDVIRNLNAEG